MALFVGVAAFGLYVGELMFGNDSFETLLALEEKKEYLKNEIEHLKEENAKYQKEYFELKRLQGDKNGEK